MECGESSPLCFIRKKSGDDSPHSIRFAISVTAIVSNPVHPIDNRSRRVKFQEKYIPSEKILTAQGGSERGSEYEEKTEQRERSGGLSGRGVYHSPNIAIPPQ
jgi:hypothetical protein